MMPIVTIYLCWNCRSPLQDWIDEFYCQNCTMIVNRERAIKEERAQKDKLV